MEPLPELEVGSWALLTVWDLELAGHISSGHVTHASQPGAQCSDWPVAGPAGLRSGQASTSNTKGRQDKGRLAIGKGD